MLVPMERQPSRLQELFHRFHCFTDRRSRTIAVEGATNVHPYVTLSELSVQHVSVVH